MPSANPATDPSLTTPTVPIAAAASPSHKARRASLKVLSRNINQVVLGNLLFDTWYYSPYPDSIIHGEDHVSSHNNLAALSTAAASKYHSQSMLLGYLRANGIAEGGADSISGSVVGPGAAVKVPPTPCSVLHVCPYCFRYSPKVEAYVQHLRRHTVTYDPHSHSQSDQDGQESPDNDKDNDAISMISDDEDTSAWPVPSSAVKVYSHAGYTVWDVDGEREKLYCQNLSLFGKLFLEQKSVFFDTGGFHYFVLTYTPPYPPPEASSVGTSKPNAVPPHTARTRRASSTTIKMESSTTAAAAADGITVPEEITLHTQVLGFFSKENLSWDANNLACILVFPPYQHRNLGQLLMAVSYKLSGWEWEDSIIGGPEKPLSAMGRKSYLRFWSERVARFMMGQTSDADGQRLFDSARRQKRKKKASFSKEEMTVKEVGDRTGMLAEDVIAALNEMGVMEVVAPKRKKRKSNGDETAGEEYTLSAMVVHRTKVLQWAKEKGVDLVSPIREEGFLGEWALSEFEEEEQEEEDEEEVEESE